MGGGLMQLVAYGAQDMFLTGNPQITFFKVVYRRHTNFAMEAISQTFEGNVESGCQVSATLARNGDLIHRVYLEITTTGDANTEVLSNAFALIDHVDLEIGGQLIDRHYGQWMAMWCELTHDTGKNELLSDMIRVNGGKTAWVPLQFSFCRNPGLSLPLIALQYHEVKINIKFSSTIPSAWNYMLWTDYIYLDSDERRKFAQSSHEYLIEQVQNLRGNCVRETGKDTKIPLYFNHPVKELFWLVAKSSEWKFQGGNTEWTENPFTGKMLIRLNGHERFASRDEVYFRDVQKYQHHTGGAYTTPYGSSDGNKFWLYSFALNPEQHQPSGTCNFSKLDNASLEVRLDPLATQKELDVYAMNYNVLRIMSGMGGLAFSN